MRQLNVWFTALGAICVIIITWAMVTPIGGKFTEYFDDTIDFSENPLAQDAYDTHTNTLIWGNRSILFIGVGVFLIWALASMQRTEEYSGVYR